MPNTLLARFCVLVLRLLLWIGAGVNHYDGIEQSSLYKMLEDINAFARDAEAVRD